MTAEDRALVIDGYYDAAMGEYIPSETQGTPLDEAAQLAKQREAADEAQAEWLRRYDEDTWDESVGSVTAEHEWLRATTMNLDLEIATIHRDAKERGVSPERVEQSAQVQALRRRQQSLRHRFNFRRYVHAIELFRARKEDREADFEKAMDEAETWRAKDRLTYQLATESLRAATRRWATYEDFGVEGLI